MTTAAAGPFASMELASLGADVTKIEPPHGDVLLAVPPTQRGLSCAYSSCNLGKRSIALDVRRADDRELAYEMIRQADVFVENARSDAKVEALGMGFETLIDINPKLVYATSRAWGHRGPMKDVGGAAPAVEAFSACPSITGAPGGRPEFTRLAGLLDFTTSSFFAAAILDGLLRRQRTGKGVLVRTSMLGSAISLQTTRIAEYFATGVPPARMGSAAATTAPHQAFECRDRKWLVVGVENDQQWSRLCVALDRADLAAEPRFATNPARVEHRVELLEILEPIIREKPLVWWLARLRQARVPNSALLDFATLRDLEHVVRNEYIVPIDVPHQGRAWFGGVPWRFSKSPAKVSAPPFPGQHTDEVRAEYGFAPGDAPTGMERERSGSF